MKIFWLAPILMTSVKSQETEGSSVTQDSTDEPDSINIMEIEEAESDFLRDPKSQTEKDKEAKIQAKKEALRKKKRVKNIKNELSRCRHGHCAATRL